MKLVQGDFTFDYNKRSFNDIRNFHAICTQILYTVIYIHWLHPPWIFTTKKRPFMIVQIVFTRQSFCKKNCLWNFQLLFFSMAWKLSMELKVILIIQNNFDTVLIQIRVFLPTIESDTSSWNKRIHVSKIQDLTFILLF